MFRKFFTLFSKKILYKCTIKTIRRVTDKENNLCPLRPAITWSDRWNPKIWQVLPVRSIEHLVKRWQTWSNGRIMRSWEKQTKIRKTPVRVLLRPLRILRKVTSLTSGLRYHKWAPNRLTYGSARLKHDIQPLTFTFLDAKYSLFLWQCLYERRAEQYPELKLKKWREKP